MNRRDFLKTSFLSLALGSGVPGFLSRTALAAIAQGKLLVVIQLSGGNDALNTLVPYSNGAYYAARPNLAIAHKDVLTLSSDVGLNPNLRPLMGLWDSGNVALIQGVGYPNPNRSHFQSMAIWHTANDRDWSGEGWIGQIADKYGDPFCATNFGNTTPQALRGGEVILPSIQNLDRFQLKLPDTLDQTFDALLSSPMAGRAETLRKSTLQMLENTDRVQKSLSKYNPGAKYPQSALATSLRDIARMIAAHAGPRVFYTAQGGYDTHAAQPMDHPKLLSEHAEALVAFQADLETQGRSNDVLIIGFSEFGRRLAENASIGTDHGKAGVMFAIGQGVQGGLYGKQPDLERLDDGDPVFTTDFRSVYATALDTWLNIPSQDILGASYSNIGFLQDQPR